LESAQNFGDQEQGGVEKLFFELSSESRLGILRELQDKPLKTPEIARNLKLTDTEAIRQTHRLGEAPLIQRQPDGAYKITQYGKLMLQFAKSFDFGYKNRNCLLTRDIWRLPEEFIDRLGALSQTRRNLDILDTLNRVDAAIASAEKYIWVISNLPQESMGSKVLDRVSKGVSFRLLFHENFISLYKDFKEVEGKFEKRALSSIPGTMLCTEKVAGICIASIDGRDDYALFYGQEPAFMKWANDLFLYFWSQGKRCYPEIKNYDDI